MARISTYPIDTTLSGEDKWIGSDSSYGNATKNFTINRVAEFLNGNNKIKTQSLQYQYQDWQLGEVRNPGTISFKTPQPGDTTLFSDVTGFMLSRYEYNTSLSISDYYTSPLAGAYVLISETLNKNNWGIYLWNSSTQDNTEIDFYNIDLTLVSSSGSLVDGKNYYVSLLQLLTLGPTPVSDKNFVYTQNVPSNVWVITHNLDKYAAVSVVDSAGTVVVGDIKYNSLNQVTVTFSAPFSGQAFLN